MNFSKKIDFSLKMLGMFALWLFGHPYGGLYHDARLYNLQALSHLYPDIYKRDLFLAYGSQDNFSIFSNLYAAAIKFLGINTAVLALTFLGQLLWFASTAFLLSRLLKGFSYWAALAFIILLPSYYGSDRVFSYGESFLTSRIYAEAFGLLAIAFAVNAEKKFDWRMPVLLLLSFALHPLMALGIAAVLFFYCCLLYWQWLKQWLLVAIAVALSLSILLLQVEPFNRALLIMDEEWFRLVLSRSPFMMVTHWDAVTWIPVIFNISTLAMAWQAATKPIKHLFLAVILTSTIGLVVAAIGGDIFHNALIIQLQLWRWTWLLQWFNYVGFAWFVGHYWQHSQVSKAAIILMACSWFLRAHAGGLLAPIVVAVWFWLIKINYRQNLPKIVWIGIGLIALQTAIWFFLDIIFYLQIVNAYYEGNNWFGGFRDSGLGVLLLLVFWLVNFFYTKNTSILNPWLSLTNVICLLVVIMRWDDDMKPKYFPSSPQRVEEFAALRQLIPEQANVYWEGNDAPSTWLLLQRANYISSVQAAGIAFNRETAFEALRRSKNILPLSPRDNATTINWKNDFFPSPKLDANLNDLTKVCQDPVLDFVVFNFAIKDAVEVAELKNGLYLYDCTKLRQG